MQLAYPHRQTMMMTTTTKAKTKTKNTGTGIVTRPHFEFGTETQPKQRSRLLLLLLVVVLWFSCCCDVSIAMGRVGGRESIPNAENNVKLQGLAKFAVEQENRKQNGDLVYIRLVSAEQQVVQGIMYYLTLLASSDGQTNLYEAKVWVKSWEHFKSLEGFQLKNSSSPGYLGDDQDQGGQH